MDELDDLWRQAFRIRAVEQRLLSLFSQGKVQGTVHTCSGQEWCALAVVNALGPEDPVFSNHRGHGHFLARHPDLLRPLLAEIMGKAEGLCGGIGGSQHLFAPLFYSNGIQGGMTPIAAGMALAGKVRKLDRIVTVFIGDGTLGEGVLYETMNMAALYELPLLFVLERNGYAQSTPTSRTIAGDVAKRAEGFGLPYFQGDVWHWEALCKTAAMAAMHIRGRGGPAFLEIECFRLNAHSKGDDTRPPELVQAFADRDPLEQYRRKNPQQAALFETEAAAEIDRALAAIAPEPCAYTPEPASFSSNPDWQEVEQGEPLVRHGESVYHALASIMESDVTAVLLGEDIAAPYGGAFRITRDLSERYPDRVFSTPISEAGIVGMGTGLALGGCRPLVEIMFGDFLTLTFDQLQQHAAKIPIMSNGQYHAPLIVRTPVGGRRGYGPTHSQSLEKHFLGIPNLALAAVNSRLDPARIYTAARQMNQPVVVLENKCLYSAFWPAPLPDGYRVEESKTAFPVIRLRPVSADADVTIVCYGGSLDIVESALADAFRDDEILGEILCYSLLTPLDTGPLFDSLRHTGRLLTVEEGPGQAGWGAELVAQTVSAGIALKAAARVSYDGIIPASAEREADLLPNAHSVRDALKTLV